MRLFNSLKKKTPSDTYWIVQLECKKVPAHSSLEPPLEYNQDQMPAENQGSLWTFLGVMEILCSFILVLEGKTSKEIPESLRLEFLEKFSANNFALSDAEGNISGALNKGDFPLLRILLAIRQKSREPRFLEVTDSFALLAYASFAA